MVDVITNNTGPQQVYFITLFEENKPGVAAFYANDQFTILPNANGRGKERNLKKKSENAYMNTIDRAAEVKTV